MPKSNNLKNSDAIDLEFNDSFKIFKFKLESLTRQKSGPTIIKDVSSGLD